MCGRYYVDISGEFSELYRIFHDAMLLRRRNDFLRETGEALPSMVLPTIAKSRNGSARVFPMKWGYSLPNLSRLIINARSETAAEKPLFAKSMAERRCAIPASYYFEYQKTTGKPVKYAFRDPNQSIIYMAGLYRYEDDDATPSFTILTRQASAEIAHIHDRMPVIITAEKVNNWVIFDEPDAVLETAITDLVAEKVV